MNLYPLSTSPKMTALALADIHLTPIIEFSVRILNSVLHRIYGQEVAILHCANGEIDYSINGIPLLPPLWRGWSGRNNSTAKWVDWAEADHRHCWWIYTMLWFAHKERIARLELPVHDDWKKAENWNVAKLFKVLPNPSGMLLSPPEYFPSTKEVQPFVKPGKDIVSAYVAYYSDILRHTKAKWTNRETPEFFKPETMLVIVK